LGKRFFDQNQKRCYHVRVTEIETVLPVEIWREKVLEHKLKATRWTVPARERRAANQPHPIEDFIFTYYHFSYAKIEEWHPEYGVRLEWNDALPQAWQKSPYEREGDALRMAVTGLKEKEIQRLIWTRDLMAGTQERAPIFSCHGLHEWAMVYRGEDVRHGAYTKLRLSQAEVDALVESRPIRCTHFDAFRFFHPQALPLNRFQPTLLGRPEQEQPGCVHANMDLYKWAYKSMPWVGSDMLLACLELAIRLRSLDMRASPYDLSDFGCEPVKIETAEGRRLYEQEQLLLAQEAAPLRQRMVEILTRVIQAIG
jgi:hypothetical protein